MASWTLLALDPPLSSSDQRSELSMASNRSMSFELHGASKLSFELPGRHWQTELIEPLTTDILVYRDSYAVQRYRVIGMNVEKSGGALKCSYTAVSYKDILNGWMFHASHTRNWVTPTAQTTIAWTIISQTQSMAGGNIGVTQGVTPVSVVNRVLDGLDDGSYFPIGARKGDAIRDLGQLDNGFEWDIEPDRSTAAASLTGLKFNSWNQDARRQYTPRCPLVLDDGGNVASWSRESAPSEFANVIYATGKVPTDSTVPDAPVPTAWEPSSENPGGLAPEGRWERAFSSEATSTATVAAFAASTLDRTLAYQPAWKVELAPGRWSGPAEMWVGDWCRMIVQDGPVDVDADVRVVGITIAVDDENAEKLSLDIDRPARSYGEFRSNLERRLLNLERR